MRDDRGPAAPGPVQVAHALGITPTWLDGTSVGGTSFLIHVRHAVAAIRAGLCHTVLITHGESGKSNVGRGGFRGGGSSLAAQFEQPYGPMGPPTLFTIPVLRYLKTHTTRIFIWYRFALGAVMIALLATGWLKP